MSYTTTNGTTNAMATSFYAGAQGQPEILVDTTLRMAERVVKGLAAPPDPIEAEYTQAASDAELFVFRYIFRTEGFIGGQRSLVGSSVTYQGDPKVMEIVTQTMGGYAAGNKRRVTTHPTLRG